MSFPLMIAAWPELDPGIYPEYPETFCSWHSFVGALGSSIANRRTPEQPERHGMRQMGVRRLFIASVSICLLPGDECAYAQDAAAPVQALPAIVVSGPATSAKRGRA